MGKFCFFILIVVALSSCQKEIGFETASQGSSDSLLYKMILNDGTTKDSAIFLYNSSKKLIGLRQTGGTSNRLSDADVDIKYDAGGRIASHTNSDGTTSIVFTVTSKDNKYSYKTGKFEVNGDMVKDSIAYQYDASGRINATLEYDQSAALGFTVYTLIAKAEYSYDSRNNISKIIISVYDDNTNTVVTLGEYQFTYDEKRQPLKLGNDAIVLEQEEYYNSNNTVKSALVYYNSPSDNMTSTTNFTYNSSNQPKNGIVTVENNSATANISYVYQ